MDFAAGISLLLVMMALAAVPSASVALVVTRSATLGFANGAAVALGIVLGDLLFVAVAILGMSFLAETMGAFFLVLKHLGGAYLIWLGIGLLRAPKDLEIEPPPATRRSLLTSFAAGLVLTLGDVKAIFSRAFLFGHIEIESRWASIAETDLFRRWREHMKPLMKMQRHGPANCAKSSTSPDRPSGPAASAAEYLRSHRRHQPAASNKSNTRSVPAK
jgi:arginine exporter protein ArgO